jgi:hypothetical protein
MVEIDRRQFLKHAGMTALTGAVVTSVALRRWPSVAEPPRRWDDPAVWPSGRVPGPGEIAQVATAVLLDRDASVGGLTIEPGGSLSFAADRSVALESTGNVIVSGHLTMTPSSPSVTHTLRFRQVNEAAFQGGGMDPLASDVGLWVMGQGRLDLRGSPKQGWGYESTGSGWAQGDELIATPVAPGDFAGFRQVQLGGPVPASYRPSEVLNLTRNVRVEATPQGRSHVFIRSSAVQRIEYVQFRHLGPFGVLGRYPLHFHHCMDGSRGSIVRGVVVREVGNHAFVPHHSHGITFQDCIAYDVVDDAYWWDRRLGRPDEVRRDPTLDELPADDITWEGSVAALVRSFPSNRNHPFRLSGFRLGKGTGNRCVGCVAVGVEGGKNSSGFQWPEGAASVWTFEDNVAHNNRNNGIFVWQNSGNDHLIERFLAYHNGRAGIEHGAYLNGYRYVGGTLYGNATAGIILHALAKTDPTLTFRDWKVEASPVGLLTQKHTLPATVPVQFVGMQFAVPTPVRIDEQDEPSLLDFIASDLEIGDFELRRTVPGMVIRVQNADQAVAIDHQGIAQSIVPFADLEQGSTPASSAPSAPQPSMSETVPPHHPTTSEITQRDKRRNRRRLRRLRGRLSRRRASRSGLRHLR